MTHRLENTARLQSRAIAVVQRGDRRRRPRGAARTSENFRRSLPSYRSRLADLLGLRYIASRGPIEDIDPHLEPGALPVVGKLTRPSSHENPAALPRVMFATQWQVADFVQMTRTGIWPSESNNVVLLERPPQGPRIRSGAARAEVAIASTGTPKCSSMCRRIPEDS